MINIWRLQTKSYGSVDSIATNTSKQIGMYCVNNNILAIGWSLLPPMYEEYQEERKKIKTFDDYCKLYKKANKNLGLDEKVNSNVLRFYNSIRKNDLVWIHTEGKYYLGRVTKDSKWIFNCSKKADELDACNQITNIDYVEFEDESSVAGVITTSFISTRTLQRIIKDGAKEFSCYTFDKRCNTNIYQKEYNFAVSKNKFYGLISPNDCEDLLYSYLYYKYNYLLFPSTSKKGTELYEFVMKDIANNENIYVQVKKGEDNLNGNNYRRMVNGKGKMYLLSTEGEVTNCDGNKIIRIDPEELYQFAINKANEKYLSESIITWKNMFSK